MPRTNNNRLGLRIIEDSEFVAIPENPRSLIVQEYLRDHIFDLTNRLGAKIDVCSVCEEESHCKKCTCITICGHILCVTCLYKLRKVECPVCRFPSK
jgi:hypothetical protein